jgi:hypothetical protein
MAPSTHKKKLGEISLPIDILLSAVSVLVVAQPSSEIPEGVMNYPVLTPWSRVLLEKLTGSQLVKKFPTFFAALSFITEFTNARHLSLS